VRPKNPHLFSRPGYAEILTGQYQTDVVSNDVRRYPHPTVLEFVRRELGLGKRQVATFGSWEGFATPLRERGGGVFTNAGYERVPPEIATPRMASLNELQFEIMALWEEGRSDAVTFNLALEYLKAQAPAPAVHRLGESDDWAHARRYDRLLDYINVFDGYLKALWDQAQSPRCLPRPDHSDRDHRPRPGRHALRLGRARRRDRGLGGHLDRRDRPRHARPRRAAPYPTVHQADVAATLLRFFGLDPAEFQPRGGPADPGGARGRRREMSGR